METLVTDVFAEFASPLGSLEPAAAADIARLEALVGPIPGAWKDFLGAAGASTGNLKLRGQHTDLGLSLAADVLPVLEKARKKEAAKGLKLAPGVATRFMIGKPRGSCQDCGPVWLDTSTEYLPRAVREALAASGANDPVAVQLDEGEPRGKRAPAFPFVLGESLAAWLFDAAFRQFRLPAAGPPQVRSVRPEHASAPHSLFDALGRAAISEGFRRHELSRFALTAHFTRENAAAALNWDGNAVVLVYSARTPAIATRLAATLSRPR